jgi:hypothetical protein
MLNNKGFISEADANKFIKTGYTGGHSGFVNHLFHTPVDEAFKSRDRC